jgi:predicted nuclease of restriction endonuclease-like (RecB) superfamily
MSKQLAAEPADYSVVLADIKQRVRHAQARALLAVNAELIRLYWEIGALIDSRQAQEGWGSAVIPRLSRDLHNELPDEKGFSERNIKRMLAFYRAYPELEFVPQPVAQSEPARKVPQAAALFLWPLMQSLPWGHHVELMAKVKDLPTRHWYMQAAVSNGWSRNVLLMQIESAAHRRLGKLISNFALRLPEPDSDLVQQTMKDPYLFDFLTLGLILCQQPNKILAEYALRGVDKPIGVSSYELTRALPTALQTSLPSIEQIERELGGGEE